MRVCGGAPNARCELRMANNYADTCTMRTAYLPRGDHLLARLAALGAVLDLVVAGVLILALDEPQWAVVVLALPIGVGGVFALLQIRLGADGAPSQDRQELATPGIPDETGEGLPVYPSTGLYRWWVFRQRLAEEIARADRYQRSFVVVLLEPANLLADPTDDMYARAAKALRQSLRFSDFAGQFDEERFLALLPETDRAGAKIVGHRLLADLRSSSEPPIRWRGALVTYPEDGDDPDALIDRAFMTLRGGRLESARKSPSPAQPEAQPQLSE